MSFYGGGCWWRDWRDSRLPLVRIDIPAGRSAADRAAIAETVYTSMLEVLKVPKDDRFEVIAEHSEGELVIDPTYLGIRRSKEAILIQVTLNEGRSVWAISYLLHDGLSRTHRPGAVDWLAVLSLGFRLSWRQGR
jgi:4-oxalocrotonate tautomerase